MKISILGKQSIYIELVEQYRKYIDLGVLEKGEKLPSCRSLALELGVNPNTVERAYKELEKLGYIVLFEKKGAFVSGKREEKETLIEKNILELKNLGVSKDELFNIIEKVYGERKDD